MTRKKTTKIPNETQLVDGNAFCAAGTMAELLQARGLDDDSLSERAIIKVVMIGILGSCLN